MGGPRDGADFQNLHRNKRSMTLNLKAPEGLAAFKRMVKKADVVVENFRPDVKNRLGIDYETLAKINPRLVYASISGFGQDGPLSRPAGLRSDRAGHGRADVGHRPARARAGARRHSGRRSAAPACSRRLGILVALLEREKSGKGQQVATSLLQAQIFMLDFQAARYLVKGEVAKQAGNNHPTSMPTGVFKTDDGHINIAAAGQTIWERFCEALGAPELAEQAGISDRRGALEEPRRAQRRDRQATVARTSAEWVERLNEAGVPVRADLCHRPDVRRSAGRASRHRAERDEEGQGHDAAASASRSRCRARRRSSWRGRRSSASTPTRCSRNSASARAKSRRCTRRKRCNRALSCPAQAGHPVNARHEIKFETR